MKCSEGETFGKKDLLLEKYKRNLSELKSENFEGGEEEEKERKEEYSSED